MSAPDFLFALFLGLGLAASTGLNTFLPLLLLAAAARFDIAGVSLGDKFQWLSSDTAIILLIVACIVEIVADKFPAVDHFLDAIGTFVRPVAGTLAAASVFTGVEPMTAAVIGLIVGGPVSFTFHTLKAGTRVASSAATFGCANPVISLAEDVLSLVLSVIAIFMPIIAPIVIALFLLLMWKLAQRIKASPAARSTP